MEFEKLKKIIAEVLNVDEEEIAMETTFVDAENIVTVSDAVEKIKNALNS